MALKGQGDKRWKVRERADGTNVNGWHWEERSASSWAHNRIKELLKVEEIVIPPVEGSHKGARVEDLEMAGDASLMNRKGVLKVLYDLKATGKWKSEHEEEADRTHGTFQIDIFDDTPEVVLTMDAKSKCEAVYKSLISSELQARMTKAAPIFISELRAGAGQPLDGVSVEQKKKPVTETKVSDFLSSSTHRKQYEAPAKPTKTTLDFTDNFNCTPRDLFAALTERKQLEAVMRSECVSEPKEGSAFSLMKGTVTGVYRKLVPGEQIDMVWKMKSWDVQGDGVRCTVTMEAGDNGTVLRVRFQDIPSKYCSEARGFWLMQAAKGIKVVLGYGGRGLF